jgi:type IV secretion system protein VirB10
MRNLPVIGIWTVLALLNLFAPLWGQPDTYRQAYDSGYEDGQTAGTQDRISRKPFDFANNPSYQDGLRGFKTGSHDRDVYIVAYRRGFEDGYEEGYGLVENKGETPPDSPSLQSNTQTGILGQPTNRNIIPTGTEIKTRLLETLSSRRNERGDEFYVEVLEPVKIEQTVSIPRGTRIHGTITYVKRAGRIKGRSEMNLKFDEMEFPDGNKIPIDATVASIEERADEEVKDGEGTIQGQGTKGKDAKKVGAAAGLGALLGVLGGGGKGAKIGAATGAVAGLAGVLATRGDDIVLYSETELILRMDRDAAFVSGLLRSGP